MELKDITKKKRKQLTSQDLKRRLYEKGAHGNSMPSLKNPLIADRSSILYVNLNSSLNKRENNLSPKILKKTGGGFGESSNKKSYLPQVTTNNFHIKKKSGFKIQQNNSPTAKTAINFYKHRHLDSQPSQEVIFNSSFYKNDSRLKQNQTRMTKRLVQKLSGHSSSDQNEDKRNNKFAEQYNSARSKQQKDQVIQRQTQDLQEIQHSNNQKEHSSSLQQYIRLILKNVANVDEFLYLVRRSRNITLSSAQTSTETTQASSLQDDNIYQLQIIDYQRIKSKDKQPNFQYYTISKKGFCHYYNGKPIQFIDLHQWLQEKQIYQKIKKLNFFNRFRRWKMIKMWIKKVVRHRIQIISQNLDEKLFILNPTVRNCILQVKSINLQMEKSLAIISRNQGTYSLQSFKHCQQKTRRQASGIVEQFSRRSRHSVKKCFQINLQNLKQILKTKTSSEDKNFAATSHNPKDNAFQVLGFPAKMSYQHRSKLRKLTGRFVRFSYLIDFIHLNGLAGIFKSQIQSFSQKLNNLQIQSEVQIHYTAQNKTIEQGQKQKMFNIQLLFKPNEIAEYSMNEVGLQIFDISMKIQKAIQIFNPLYHIKQKQVVVPSKKKLINEEALKPLKRKYIPNICDLWLSLKPTLDNIFDELSFLIKQSMTSLKYFQRWSKHRQMQKYINILQEWDDIVSQNWQICENDNLDPISIIDNLQSSMSKIKQMIQISQTKLTQKIIDQTTQPLNVYWQNTQANVEQLLTNQNIQNSAQTIEFYLTYMTQQIQRFEHKIPNNIELGIFSISLDKMKNQTIQFMKNLFENFKTKLPSYVEEHTNDLNNWLSEKSQKLREEIHNIDDFVRLNKSLKQIQAQFFDKKDLCNDLGHVYQTMYNFKIQAKRRKQFEVHTLKAKDQLEQLLIGVQQNIERKTQFFTRQVSRYHLPNLIKDIQKISDNIGSQEFESLKSSSSSAIKKLIQIKTQYEHLKQKKQKCLEYLSILKLSEVNVDQLDELQKQINSRLAMWENIEIFDEFIQKIENQVVNTMDLQKIKDFVTDKRNTVRQIQNTHNKPQNEVLQLLKQKVDKYFINIPLLQGFNDKLSQSHWQQINQILKDYPSIDLRKKQFSLKKFLQTQIGKESKKIEFIFSKAKVQNQLQQIYSEIQNVWLNTLVKSKVQSKFIVISNPQVMKQAFDYMIKTLCTILSNPFSQTLKQYSVTYDLLISYYNIFENWISLQQKMLKIDSQCKMLDVKKLPDYGQFQNCQKIYKNIMKLFSNRNVQTGVKISKLFVNGLDQKLLQMEQALKKVEDNIKTIIDEHRKNYPPFYLFDDQKLFKIITQPSNPAVIQQTAKQLFNCIEKIDFQGQRISGIYNFDQQKMQKSMISITLDIEQILLQINDTIVDINRKNMRSCRYKAVETNLVKLVPLYQTQYLLAISKIDFSNYTEISIDNQGQISDSLKEFYKVMKKDITEDLRIRNSVKHNHLARYDTLISQTLYHEELLSDLIKKNVVKTNDFEWQRQLRFAWQQSNNEEANITVKHCNAKIKYGNQYIGSRAKVVTNNDSNLIFSLSLNQTALFTGSQYNLEKILNFIGHRSVFFNCQNSTTFKQLTNFLIGNWYNQIICLCKNFDYLNDKTKQEILLGTQIQGIKDNLLKKNVYSIKQNQKKQTAIFLSLNIQTKIHDFRGKCRVITASQIQANHIKNLLKIKGIFDNNINEFLLKLFQMINYLQEKSQTFNISLQNFLDVSLTNLQNLSKKQVFEEFVKYIKPKIGLDNFMIIQQSVKLYLCESSIESLKDEIIETNSSKVAQKNKQKQKSGSKRCSSRSSQNRSNQGKLVAKPQQKCLKTKSPTSKCQESDQDQSKYHEIKQALSQRNIIILTGIGNSKLYSIKSIYSSSHKVLQLSSFLEREQSSQKSSLLSKYIQESTQQNCVLYFDGVSLEIIKQMEAIWYNQYKSCIRNKLKQRNILVCIAAESLHYFDYSSLSSFYIVNVELNQEYLTQVGKNWSQKQLLIQKQQQAFCKFFNDTLLSTFQNWCIKDIKTRQRHVFVFLTYLKSLLPVNKLLQAMVYCFIRVFSNLDADYIKLQFLVKKLIGDDKLSEEYKVYDLIYHKNDSSEQIIPQGLIYSYKVLDKVSLQNQKLYFDYVITPQIYHYTTIMNRILYRTNEGIWIAGGENSGKSSLCEIFKHMNYNNKSYLKLSLHQKTSKDQFKQRILNNLNVFSLNQIKSRVNYQNSVIMIDDISMSSSTQNSSQRVDKNSVTSSKLQLIKQLIKYRQICYPKQHFINNKSGFRNFFQNKLFNLDQVKFILSGKDQIQSLKQCTIPIQLTFQQTQLKSIFLQYTKQRLSNHDINDLTLNDIVTTTYDICKKISARNGQFDGMEISKTKYILERFSHVRIKDHNAAGKELQKYWVYLLNQQLAIYQSKIGRAALLSSSKSSQQESIVMRQLKNFNLQQIKSQSLLYSHLHIKDSGYNKKLQYVKDIKKIFNIINQKIQKYNQSENKRYGTSFDFIHFDQLIRKIIKISNNLTGKDYLLYGRKGTGKQSLIKLIAYLQGSNYKFIEANLKSSIMDIFVNTNITTMSSYLITQKINTESDIQQIQQFYYTDFQNQILGHKDLQKPIKIPVKEKDKQFKQLSTTNKSAPSKTFANLILSPEYYVSPRPRLTREDGIRYRNAIRVIILTNNREIIQKIPVNIRINFTIDQMDEIPIGNLQQYCVKFLDAQQIKYSPKAPQLLSQIYNFEKQTLSLSLKSNDDCIRLFSSFMSTLKQEIKEELVKYGRIMQLFNQIRKLHQHLQIQVEQLHSQIKSVNQLLIIEQTQERKQQKSVIETQLHKKSNSLSKSQKIIQMLNMLIPQFKNKHSLIQRYILDVDYFEESLVVASCYFTFLSQLSLAQRRQILHRWYRNQDIPLLMNSQPALSFLTLFNLYHQQFNAQPIDDIQDFYENMAIVFNSVKPVIIIDKCKKGKKWLQNVCTFVVVSQRENNFVDIICENLVKPSNILIQITNQETMNNISTSFINTLLFLSESTETINIKGQDIKVSPQAKFYLLLGQGVIIPSSIKSQFTQVSFSESPLLLQRSLQYSYMGVCHPEVFFTQLDFKKKIRNLKLQRQALMLEIAQNIYLPFQNKQTKQGEEQKNQKQNQQVQFILSQTRQYFQKCVCDISDKTMTRGQNLANKLKQKQQLCKDLEQKHDNSSKFVEQTKNFILQCKNLLSILELMSINSLKVHKQFEYPIISHQQFVKKINIGLKRNFISISNILSLYLFAIKIWGVQYVEKDFYIFIMLIFSMVQRLSSEEIQRQMLCDRNNKTLSLEMKIQNLLIKNCDSFDHFQQETNNHMSEILSKFSYESLIPYLQFSGSISNLQQGQDRKVVLNCIWMSKNAKMFQQKIQESLKVVSLQIKDTANLQTQIKKYLFEQNVLVINSLQVLEITLDYLRKLGAHEKTIYYKCPLIKKQIQIVQLLAKKNGITEINNIYSNKNPLFSQCLQKVQKQRQLKKMSSVSNIKSMKSIGQIKSESDSNNNIMNSNARPYDTKKRTILLDPNDLRLTKIQKTEKNILSQTNTRSQELIAKFEQIVNKLNQIFNQIYSSLNLKRPFLNQRELKDITEYIINCNPNNQQYDLSIQQKVYLLLKIFFTIKKQNFALVDSQFLKKINQLTTIIQPIFKQALSPLQQLDQIVLKLQELSEANQNVEDYLSTIQKKATRIKFEYQFLSYFKKYLSIQENQSQITKSVKKAKKLYQSIRTINQPLSVKRSSRKSINAFFRKDQIKQKFFTSPLTSALSNTGGLKKPGIKRMSKQAMQSHKNKQLQNQQNLQESAQQAYLTQLMLEIQLRKLQEKINSRTVKIQAAIDNLEISQLSQNQNIYQQLQLILLLLQDKIPGQWLIVLGNSSYSSSLTGLFKKYIRLQQDIGYNLQKIKRSKHSQVDFNYLRYPLEYIQFHFKKKITPFQSPSYVLSSNPTPQELQTCQDYLKITSIQTSGWKFSSQPNSIDILSGVQKQTVSEGKIMAACFFIKKQSLQTINMTCIDVYQNRNSQKPIMKVYANSKKNTNFNSATNALSLFLKEENYM